MTHLVETSDYKNTLQKYLFPVEERKVYFQDANGNPDHTKEYKSIVRADNNKLISIMNNTYKFESNAAVILPVLDELSKLDSKWTLDRSHSYVKNNKMRLQVTFPDLTFSDGDSDIALSLFLHNSYDGSEGVRMFFGAIRFICTNGMVFGNILAKYYRRHTKNIQVSNIVDKVHDTFDSIPVIKERIEILQNLEAGVVSNDKIEKQFGKKALNYVTQHSQINNQWALYNILSYYISHMVQPHMRASYQLKLSKMFEL